MKKNSPKITVINVFSFILFVLTIIFMSVCVNRYSEPIAFEENLEHIDFSGIYIINDDYMTYTVPDDRQILVENIDKINFELKFSDDIAKGTQINFYIDNVNIQIYRNNTEIYSYNNTENQKPIASVVGTKWIHFTSPGIKANETITIVLTGDSESISPRFLENFLVNISQGSNYALLMNQVKVNLPHILMAVLTFIIGFILLVLVLTFKIMRSPIDIGSLSCTMVCITGSIATFINYDYTTLLFPDSILVNIIDYLNLLLLMLFILFYIRIYIHTKAISKVIDFFIYVWTLVIVGYFIYQVMEFDEIILLTDCTINVATLILFFLIVFMIIEYKNCKGSRFTLVFTLLLIISLLAEVFTKVYYKEFIYIAFGVGILVFSVTHFIAIMIKTQKSFVQAAKAEQFENELVQSKVSVMLSQIQPHFLYNTLVVIRQLCDIDPKTAKEAVTEFATYLRGNLDSLTLNTTIPFEKEMEHIENYVSLEKKRFGDRINMDYDIECVDFEVPSLTIQTIVENAIRHGITKRKEGGTVTIRTRESKKRYIIEVIDNGIGMDLTKPPEYNDNRSHVGLDNVRKRVESMCNGELLFNSTPSIGTTVYMSIPKPEIDTEKKSKKSTKKFK